MNAILGSAIRKLKIAVVTTSKPLFLNLAIIIPNGIPNIYVINTLISPIIEELTIIDGSLYRLFVAVYGSSPKFALSLASATLGDL